MSSVYREVGSKRDPPIIPVPKPVSNLELECESDDDPVGTQVLTGTVGESESGNEDTTIPSATAETTSSDHCHTPADSDDKDTESVAIATEDVSREVAIATNDPPCHLSQGVCVYLCVCVCVCACVHACVRACVRACLRVCVYAWVWVWLLHMYMCICWCVDFQIKSHGLQST